MTSRIFDLIKTLEKHYDKKVYLFCYNPRKEIEKGDEILIRNFISKEIEKRKINSCIFIIEGRGGNMKAAITSSSMIRNALEYYVCIVPNICGSAMCYFFLQSNKLIIGESACITKFDPTFNGLRSMEELMNIEKGKRDLAHESLSNYIEILKKILKRKKCVVHKKCFCKNGLINPKALGTITKVFMVGENHDTLIKTKELKKIPINISNDSTHLINPCKELIGLTKKEYFSNGSETRLVIRALDRDFHF